jgi:hypothetical protein
MTMHPSMIFVITLYSGASPVFTRGFADRAEADAFETVLNNLFNAHNDHFVERVEHKHDTGGAYRTLAEYLNHLADQKA